MIKQYGLKISLVLMIAIVAIVGVVLTTMLSATNALVSDMLHQQSVTANKAFAEALNDYQESALERAGMIAAAEEITDAVSRRDRQGLLEAIGHFSGSFDLVTVCDANGTVLVRSYSDKAGDSVLNQRVVSTALSTGNGTSTVEPGTLIGLSTRGSAAIKDKNGSIIGAITCGHDLSKNKYVDEIKARYGCEATFFAGDERMSTTIVDGQGNRVTGTKAGAAVVETVLGKKQDFASRLELFGSMYEVYYSPLIVDGQPIGMLFTGIHIDRVLAREQRMFLLIAVAAAMLLLAVLLTAFVIRWTTKKSYWYESILDSIPLPVSVTDTGMRWTFINKPVERMLGVKRADMLGKPCSSWGSAICGTKDCGIACLRDGKGVTFFEQDGMDYQINASLLRDKSNMDTGHIEVVQDISDIKRTQKAQAGLVGKIGEVSTAYVDASRQIASGAQALAQGAAEQAAAIQQISASVTETAEKAQDNAGMAEKALCLAATTKEKAENSLHQMGRLTGAISDINNASQSIKKVIKVIDDIAFQTNILALNAAVEAARAGYHGKGFAVVADEVRSLAAKSAVAAKDTGALISNSIEKAEQGTVIADEAAVSLGEIVSGIGESGELVRKIAKASGVQSASITEINQALGQITQAVQQNSATAEESAAASEVMSSRHACCKAWSNNSGLRAIPKKTKGSLRQLRRLAATPCSHCPEVPFWEDKLDHILFIALPGKTPAVLLFILEGEKS